MNYALKVLSPSQVHGTSDIKMVEREIPFEVDLEDENAHFFKNNSILLSQPEARALSIPLSYQMYVFYGDPRELERLIQLRK